MKNNITRPPHTLTWLASLKQLSSGIGTKIVLPYFLLTLFVAGVGAFIVVRLVSDSLQERFNNQLLDAGRVVSESMVGYEKERLEVLRMVAGTKGVSDSLAAGDKEYLAAQVPQIIANSNTDAIELLNNQGIEIYGWQRPPYQIEFAGEERTGADFSHLKPVHQILNGFVDDFGDKQVLLSQTPYGLMLFTVGPVYRGDEQVGAVMVGTYIREMTVALTESAIARVTLYDPQGNVIDTTLGGGPGGVTEILQEPPGQHNAILTLLRESPEHYPVVIANVENEVLLRRVQVLGQEYTLAYGDWRLRGQSMGLFSVALPSSFIVSTAATSRNLLSLLFSIATVCVFVLGFVIARRIIHPLHRLVQTSTAIAQGDLAQRTGIRRSDEIGSLAQSFDTMTDHLVARNRQLLEQAGKLEAILESIADGVIVLNQQGLIITSNPAAQQILDTVSTDVLSEILRVLPSTFGDVSSNPLDPEQQALELAKYKQPHRYQAGNRVLSAVIAPVKIPGGEDLDMVVALRDITREAEAERLKDVFIRHISHELRTPLTAIKGYTELLLMLGNENLHEKQINFLQLVDRNANTLLYHINQIIDISAIQAGSLYINKQEVYFVELVEEGAEAWRDELKTKEISLHVVLPERNLRVYGDAKRLSWALDNLLQNAYHYTMTGGHVEIRVFREKTQIRVDIIDTGVGIAKEDQPYLFTPFFRAPHPLTYNVPGVGLGLFITHALIERHEGRIWVESELNSGSTFSLTLPLLEETAAADMPWN